MIKPLVDFTNRQLQDDNLRTLGVRPKSGLHIKLRITNEGRLNGEEYLDLDGAESVYYDGQSEPGEDMAWFLERAGHIWYVSSNKAVDRRKWVHTASPYCVAVKRQSLPEAIPPGADEKRKPQGKEYAKKEYNFKDWFDGYFTAAFEHIAPEEVEWVRLFERFFHDRQQVMGFLIGQEGFYDLQEGEYVVFYLDRPVGDYATAHHDHLSQNLFNTTKYNVQPEGEAEVYGTSDFFTGYNSKKPFLEHQRAPFDIGLRISQSDAVALDQFQQLMRRGIFPRPLPVFVGPQAETLNRKFDELVQREYGKKSDDRHRDVIKSILKLGAERRAQFVLFYYAGGMILDWGRVARYSHELTSDSRSGWRIEPLLPETQTGEGGTGFRYGPLNDVFDLEDNLLPVIFDNELIVKITSGKGREAIRKIVGRRWFSELSNKAGKDGVMASVAAYRQGFYDFIYKGQRGQISASAFRKIMLASIRYSLEQDEVGSYGHTEEHRLRLKLNILCSLYGHFDRDYQTSYTMQQTIRELPNRLTRVLTRLDGEEAVHLSSIDEFTYLAGQVIRYVFQQMRSDSTPHGKLTPYLNARTAGKLAEQISKLYTQYTHIKISKQFETALSELNLFDPDQQQKINTTVLLAGYFNYARQEDRLLNAGNYATTITES